MSERFEKLYTLEDIEDEYGAPVKIEAGGLIKDTKTGRVIARMYLKKNGDKKPKSVLVGFYPKDETGRTIRGMRDYKYEAKEAGEDDIFGDNIGIIFDNNETARFSCDVKEVEFDDGGYWDENEAREVKKEREEEARKAEEDKEKYGAISPEPASIAVPETEAGTDDSSSEEYWSADDKGDPKLWDRNSEMVPGREATPDLARTGEAALNHTEMPELVEETDTAREAKERQVIELDGPSDDEGPVIELGGPTGAEVTKEPAEPVVGRLADMYSGFSGGLEAVHETNAKVEEDSPSDEQAKMSDQVIDKDNAVAPLGDTGSPVSHWVESDEYKASKGQVSDDPTKGYDSEDAGKKPEDPLPIVETKSEKGVTSSEIEPADPLPSVDAISPVSKVSEGLSPSIDKVPATSNDTASSLNPIEGTPVTGAASNASSALTPENENKDKHHDSKVFAEEPSGVPTIVGDHKDKDLTGEDHSGMNLANIVIFGGIAIIVLLLLMIFL